MAEALLNNHLIRRRADLDEFIMGFNQAAPLFQIIDVGPGKEAADAKLRGTSLRNLTPDFPDSFHLIDLCVHFARGPQTRRIYFAGA